VTAPAPTDDESVPNIPHDEFRSGLPHARFSVVVNPQLVRPYIAQRTHVNVLAITLIGVGAALALAGQALPGAVLVVLGIAANRVVRHQAAKIVLHLALKDPAVYDEVTSNGVMEVRRAD
jgi:hypothetical protein